MWLNSRLDMSRTSFNGDAGQTHHLEWGPSCQVECGSGSLKLVQLHTPCSARCCG